MGCERHLGDVYIGVIREELQRRITIINGTPSRDESEQVRVSEMCGKTRGYMHTYARAIHTPYFLSSLQVFPHFLSANHSLRA
jgi:hypothetical protein